MKNLDLKLPLGMRRFLNEQRVSCKSSTVGNYLCALRNFCSFLRAELDANAVTSKQIASINKKILDSYLINLHQQQLAPYSRVCKFLAVRKYLAWEIDRGNINKSAIENFDRLRLPKIPDCLPRPLSNETDRMLTARFRNSDSPYAKAFLLLRLTGLRISELINLSNDCVITTARNERFLKVPLGKMDNERLVPLCNEAFDIIQNFKASRGIPCKHRNPLRLIGIKGNVPNIYMRLALQFKKFTADISDQNKPITFHRLRHTYATSLLSGGVSIVSIMKLLGHRRIEMSLRYAQITPTHLRNEYFRALAVLESQYRPKNDAPPNQCTTHIATTEIINQLAAFIKKESTLNPSIQNNLIKRLSRLHNDIQNLPIPKKFPVIST